MCDEEIVVLGHTESVLSAAKEDDARTERDMITEEERTQANGYISTP